MIKNFPRMMLNPMMIKAPMMVMTRTIIMVITKWLLKNLLKKPKLVARRGLPTVYIFVNISFLMLLVMLQGEHLLVGN